MSNSKTSLALRWSIERLIEAAYKPCGFYTVTCQTALDWKTFSRLHKVMLDRMRTDSTRGRFPPFAGVRVFEEGDLTGRAHSHIVMTPRVTQAKLQHYASIAGLGFVWRDIRPAGKPLALYLSGYLSKQSRARVFPRGIRQWSCFGDMTGYKVHEIEIDSPDNRLFKSHFQAALCRGLSKTQAFTEAAKLTNLSKYRTFSDPMQGVTATVPPPVTDQTLIMKDGTVTRVLPENKELDKSPKMCIL